jgi:hypothetical protein
VKREVLDLRRLARGFERLGVPVELALLARKHAIIVESAHFPVLLEQPQRLAMDPHRTRLGVLGHAQEQALLVQLDVAPSQVHQLPCSGGRRQREHYQHVQLRILPGLIQEPHALFVGKKVQASHQQAHPTTSSHNDLVVRGRAAWWRFEAASVPNLCQLQPRPPVTGLP